MIIVEPYKPEEFKQYFRARWEILRKPWDFPRGSEIDDFENISLHVMAVEGEDVVAVGRLTYFPTLEGQIRYMGVTDKFQGMQVGSSLLAYLEKEAIKMGLKKIFLNARDTAVGFYLKKGYQTEGEPFEGFAGILHTQMSKNL